MGICGSSEKTTAPSKKNAGTPPAGGKTDVLPRDGDDYLGECWLLAETPESFSPSRWFCLSERTLAGRRGGRHCFTHSTRTLDRRERAKIPLLRENPSLCVYEGLTVTGSPEAFAVHGYSAGAVRPGAPVNVCGVHVAVPANNFAFVVVVAFRRLEIEMEPAKYATAGYRRHPTLAPPSNERERQACGEGCITGVQYGAFVVIGCTTDATVEIARACEKYLTEAGLSLACTTRPADAAGVTPNATEPVASQPLSSETALTVFASSFASATSSATDAPALRTARDIGAWLAAAYVDTSQWNLTGLFLQRYEAIGQCILRPKS